MRNRTWSICESYRGFKASERALDADKLDDQDARDLIVRAIAALYLNAQSAAARVDAAQSRVTDSSTLLKLARDKHDAGTATGVDVLRAQVQLANDKQALLVAENQLQQSLLVLARNLGMSPGTPLELAEPLRFQPLAQPEPETLVPAALLTRADYLSLASQRQGLVEQQRASRARFYPKVSVNGNFGEIGRSIGGVEGTGLIQGQIDFTVFDRDRNGEAQELAARLKRIDDQIADLRRGVDEDIREALLNLDSAAQQVTVAREGQELAQRELELAQDRFQSGTANNVEVVTAQDELARARGKLYSCRFQPCGRKVCAGSRPGRYGEKHLAVCRESISGRDRLAATRIPLREVECYETSNTCSDSAGRGHCRRRVFLSAADEKTGIRESAYALRQH